MSFNGRTELLVHCKGGASWEPIARLTARWNKEEPFKVATYKPETGEVVWGELESPCRRLYDGVMVRLKHDHLDLFVPAHHRVCLVTAFEGSGSGTWGLNGVRVFGFWSGPCLDVVSIPASQMTFHVSPGQTNLKERQTHRFVSYQKSTHGLATLFPELVSGEDIEVTSYHWSGPLYGPIVPFSYVVVRRNGKICVVGST